MKETKDTSVKERIIKDTVKYNIVQYLSQFLGIFTAVGLRRFLGPYYMGIWSLFRVIIDYSILTGLGVGTAATFQIPFLKGKGDKKAESEVTNSAFTFTFLTTLLSSFVVAGAAFILRYKYPAEIIAGLVIIAIYMILERSYSYYLVVLRANSNFKVINRSVTFDAILNLALVFLLVKNFQMNGLYVTVILMALCNVLFIHYLARYHISFSFGIKRITSLVKIGFPLLVLGILSMILRSIDRIMIAKMLGVTFVGYYSIAIMTKNYLEGAANNFGIVTIPRILETYGREEKVGHIQKFVTVSAEVISYLFTPLLGFIFLATPLVITKILPKFIPGIVASQILLLDIFFSSSCPQASQFLVALGKQAKIIPISVIAILLNICLNYIFIKMGLGICGAALGTALSSCFSTFCVLAYAMKHFATTGAITRFILRIMFPLVYISAVVFCCTYLVHTQNPYLNLGINSAVLSIFSAPLFFYIDHRTHIVRTVIGFLKKKPAH